MRKELGKIENCRFGFGGYQDACLGISFTLSGKGWAVGDFWGTWAHDPDEYTKWTVDDQSKTFAETVRKIGALLRAAGKDDIAKLKGVPVEVIFENDTLKDWRVLTEVI